MNRVRYYNPRSGRFLSEDPIGFAGGDYNLYRYVGNNPALDIDPSGKYSPLQLGYTAIRVALPALFSELLGLCAGFPDACYDTTGIDMRQKPKKPDEKSASKATCNPELQSCERDKKKDEIKKCGK